MAGHHDSDKQTNARQKEGPGEARPFYETKGKILTPVQGFAGADVLSEPPRPAALRGDPKPEGTGQIPLSSRNPTSNALGAFGLGKKPGGKN